MSKTQMAATARLDLQGRGGTRQVPLIEEEHNSDDQNDQIEDEDEAQSVLQPAMSAVAAHYTSVQTPASEKRGILWEGRQEDFFHVPVSSKNIESSSSQASSPEASPQQPSRQSDGRFKQVANRLPSPWTSGSNGDKYEKGTSHSRSASSRNVLGLAFGETRQRSRSTGQEALKRLQKAFPSISAAHFMPSLQNSIFSSFSEKPTQNHRANTSPKMSKSPSFFSQYTSPNSTPRQASSGTTSKLRADSVGDSSLLAPPRSSKPLRRVTSDESMLYNSISRASSFGDDNQFRDVREMVNMRFVALKDSLPDVSMPNFKLPAALSSLSILPSATKLGSLSLGSGSSEAVPPQQRPKPERETPLTLKDSALLDQVLKELTGDIVIMGGYRGSVLRSAEPPHHQVWAPVKLGFNMRKVNIQVPLTDEAEESMEDTIFPSGMLKHIGPIDVSRKLFKKLRTCENAKSGKLRVWDYGYDWRLSPGLLSRRLQEFLQGLPSNQEGVLPDKRGALVIAHSLGGLITRHAVNQKPELFSGVLYAGTPQRCVNILGPIRNGDVVLFNEKLLSAAVNFSIRTTFVFLPEDGFCFVNKNTREEYPVDFYDPQEWINWKFSPCIETPLPPFSRPHASSLTSLLPARLRSDSKPEKISQDFNPLTERTIVPQMKQSPSEQAKASESRSDAERAKNLEYLTHTLKKTKQFRADLAHLEEHQENNTYPPHAVLYGKNTPTVWGAGVQSRDAIRHSDAYDDLIFRPGDGVTLAKEAMLPDGYAIVRGGRVKTERGHITMLGDMPAMGRALEALIRGRRKGIGLGPDMLKS